MRRTDPGYAAPQRGVARQVLLAAMLLLAGGGALRAQEAVRYEVLQTESNLMVPMRDGVRLATDVFRPARAGRAIDEPLPVLLQRTPYDKTGDRLVEQARFFASHGYVVALQDHRGRYASEGEFTKYLGEGQDSYDAIEYLAGQPYSDGQVGMWGTSYAAHVQANAAKLDPPHLATIVLNMGGMSNGWDHKVRNHGAFEIQQLTWAFGQLAAETDDPVVRDRLALDPVDRWLTALPLRKGLNPLSIAPNFEDYVLEMLTHGDYDAYWQHPDVNWVEHYDETADIPMLLVSGWYDSYAGGTVHNYVELSRRLESPVRLLMGPWTHSRNTASHAGDVAFGPDAAIDDFFTTMHLRWFDATLKAADPEWQDEPPVRFFVMGGGAGVRDADGRLAHGGHWQAADDWPVPGATDTAFYLHGDGMLATFPPGTDGGATTYTFDPANPVPTIGGSFSSTSPVFEPGAYDQRETAATFGASEPYLPLAARADVLVFETPPLPTDTLIAGPVAVRLFIASTAIDTDFTAKLVDVYPPSPDYPAGYAMNLTDGILRTRYRNRPDRQEMLKPGEVYDVLITPFPTANLFRKGHRIRLDISSSNFPRFDVNPNTGEALGQHRRRMRADNTVFHDAGHASHVVLPIIRQ